MHAGYDFWGALYALFTRVSGLALISFGGVNTVLPALHHQAVNEQHWMTDRDFANLFALASVSPGPNFMVLTLIGFKAAGIVGAIVATFALCIPTSLLAFAVVKVWDRFKTAHWRMAIQEGLGSLRRPPCCSYARRITASLPMRSPQPWPSSAR